MIIDRNIADVLTQGIDEDVGNMTIDSFPDILDNRTISRLQEFGILTVKDLFLYSHRIYNGRIKGLGKKGIENITKLKERLIKNKIPFDATKQGLISSNELITTEKTGGIDNDVLGASLLEYPIFLSRRTISALNKNQIFTVGDILKHKSDITLNSTRGLGKKGCFEIQELLSHLKKKSSSSFRKSILHNIDSFIYIDDERLSQILSFNLIKKFNDLADYINGRKKWTELQYVNEDDIIKLTQIYNEYLSNYKVEPSQMTVSDRLKINNFRDKDLSIIQNRLIGKKTLEELGYELGITRERVRQKQISLENHISKLGKNIIESDTVIFTRVTKIIQDNGFLILPKDANQLSFLGFDIENIGILFHAVRSLEGVQGDYLEGERTFLLYRDDIKLSGKQLRSIYKYLMNKLDRNNDDMKIEDIVFEYIYDYENNTIENALSKSQGEIHIPDTTNYRTQKSGIALFIKRIVELHPDYVVQDDLIHRFKKKYKLSHYIGEVLKEHPDGLHFREIAQKIRSRYGIEASDIKVHANLGNTTGSQKYINIGKGLFTLKGSGVYSGEKTPDIIYTYLRDSGTPKTIDDIKDHVLKRKRVNINTIRASLDYKKESRFVFYNDGKVGLKEWNLGNVRPKRNSTDNNYSIF